MSRCRACGDEYRIRNWSVGSVVMALAQGFGKHPGLCEDCASLAAGEGHIEVRKHD